MTRQSTALGAALVGAIVGAVIVLGARRLSTEPHLPEPGYLSPIARGVLDRRMARHGEDMAGLLRAVILLDHKTIIDRAGAIADEPTLARPSNDDATELNNLLPERFFELQDELRGAARRLVGAARSPNLEQLATAYADLTRACVRCHGIYLQGRSPAQAPSAEGSR